MKRLTTCLEPGCSQLVEKSYCPIHQRDANRRYKDPAKRQVYASRRWRGLRRTVLKENPYCSVPGCQNLATDVHHRIALADGGDPYDKAQLEGLCKMHHSRETAQEIWGRKHHHLAGRRYE